ncbi:MAG: chemotaxis protein CheW [Rhodocyclales bacterium]|nr:chemotaxis protein CheW [Rhodocyclales bacterium]
MGRLNRREFQENLSARLAQAERGELGQSLLAVESGTDDLPGGRRWLIDLAESGEVVPLPPLTPAPLTRSWFAGVANIRGALYSVVDFAAWRGGLPTPRNAQARLLLIGARHGNNSALLVERTLGLRAMAAFAPAAEAGTGRNRGFAEQCPMPLELNDDAAPVTDEAALWQGARFSDAEGGHWTLLDIPALLVTPGWLDIAL